MSKTVSNTPARLKKLASRQLEGDLLHFIGGCGNPVLAQVQITVMAAYVGGANDEPADGPP